MASGQTTKKTSNRTGSTKKSTGSKTASASRSTAGRSSGGKTSARKTSAGRSTSSKASSAGKTSKSTSTRTGSGKNSNTYTKKYTKEEMIRRSGMYDEVKMIISLAVAIILLISTLGFGGKVGGFLSNFVFGIFGWLGYLLPYVIFFGTAFMISNKRSRLLRKKILAFTCFIICLMAFLQMLASPFDATTKVLDYYKNCSIYKNGGGLIGGVVCYVLTPLFGKVGCYVIIIIGMALGIVFMAQRAIFTVLLGKIKQWMEEYRAYTEERRLFREEAYEEEMEEGQAEDVLYITDKGKKENRSSYKQEISFAEMSKAARIQAGGYKQENEDDQEEYVPDSASAGSALDLSGSGLILNADHDVAAVEQESVSLNTDRFNYSAESDTQPEITVTRMEPIRFEDTEVMENRLQEPVSIPLVGDHTAKLPTDEINLAVVQKEDDDFSQEVFTEDSSDFEPLDFTEPVNNGNESAPKKATAKDTQPVKPEEIAPPVKEYVFPPITLLERGSNNTSMVSEASLKETAMKLQNTLDSFGVKVQVTNVSCGPSVTRYELTPDQGVKVSKIVALSDDIKLNLAVPDIRIEAPIPGKAAVGIEVPNKENSVVRFRDLIESKEFKSSKSNVSFAVGRDIGGQVIVADIAKMPHLLIAGATGSGKSVCINTLIMSIIYKSKPEDVRLIMVDPKVVELSVYNGIPHLLIPVVTDPKKAAGALNWAVMEMTDRYNKFAQLGVRDVKSYNDKIAKAEYESETYKKMPQIVIIVDELADLMMVASSEVEDAICRLAQLARAAGIHLVIATQRPSVNVITGLIKANIPSRVAFAVSSGVDSRTILDMNGAEKLLGKGDMLFYPTGMQKPLRVQGALVTDEEVNSVVEFLNEQGQTADYNDEVADKISSAKTADAAGHGAERDVYFVDAGRFIIEKDKASIGMLQRVYKIGFNRAARIMDQLSEAGVVGPEEGTKPRKVLMSAEEFEAYVEEYV